MEQNINITKYIVKFSLGYVFGLIALTVIFHIFDLDSNSGASIGVLIGAAVYAVGKFIQENKRVPNKEEKSKLVWSSLIISWGVSILLLIAAVLILDGQQGLADLFLLVEELNAAIIAGVLFFVTLLHFAVLSYSYGGLAKIQYRGLQKKGKI